MNIRIITKLMLGFLLVLVIMVSFSYYTIKNNSDFMQNSIGKKAEYLAEEMMRGIEKSINYRMDELRVDFKHHSTLLNTLNASNKQFDSIQDVNEYISNRNAEWIAARNDSTPFMLSLINNTLADQLRTDLILYHEKRYGYRFLSDIFVTNKYGTTVAQSSKTDTYRHDDEEWWHITMDNGYFFNNYEYDANSGNYGMSMAVRLEDEEGNYIGAFKAAVSAEGVIRDVTANSDKNSSALTHLITDDGRSIYGRNPFDSILDIPMDELLIKLKGNSGYFISSTSEGMRLFAFAHSKKTLNYESLGWVLVTCYSLEEILQPSFIINSNAVTLVALLILGSMLIAFFTLRYITRPLSQLSLGTEIVGRGNLDYKINVRSKDEIGKLAAAFNMMTQNLRSITASRDELNREIAERKHAEAELTKHREHLLEKVAERTIYLQQINEELEQEIAVRVKAEKEARLMALFAELNPSPVLRFDIGGKITVANNAASDVLNSGHIIGKPMTAVMPEIEGIDLSSCIRNGSVFSYAVQAENRFFHFIIKGIPEMDFGQAYAIDITDRKLAEAEAMRSSALASLGELAAGVAHEINNPINGIINFAQIILNKSSLTSRESDLAKRIIKEGDRIADIVRGLLSFAHAGTKKKRPVKVSEIIDDTLVLTGSLLKKEGIHLTVNIPDELPLIIANPQQIEQVFLNMTSNARYALNRKYPENNPDKYLEISAKTVIHGDSHYVKIIFKDHGTGISPDNMQKILNPFFSTKPNDKGTGLGLSISHGIITDHGGRIIFNSNEGDFTRAIIEIPAA